MAKTSPSTAAFALDGPPRSRPTTISSCPSCSTSERLADVEPGRDPVAGTGQPQNFGPRRAWSPTRRTVDQFTQNVGVTCMATGLFDHVGQGLGGHRPQGAQASIGVAVPRGRRSHRALCSRTQRHRDSGPPHRRRCLTVRQKTSPASRRRRPPGKSTVRRGSGGSGGRATWCPTAPRTSGPPSARARRRPWRRWTCGDNREIPAAPRIRCCPCAAAGCHACGAELCARCPLSARCRTGARNLLFRQGGSSTSDSGGATQPATAAVPLNPPSAWRA